MAARAQDKIAKLTSECTRQDESEGEESDPFKDIEDDEEEQEEKEIVVVDDLDKPMSLLQFIIGNNTD